MSYRCSLTTAALAALVVTAVSASTGRSVQDRVDADVARGRPVVVHVVVALCDNRNQGIVRVSETDRPADPRPHGLSGGFTA